MTHVVVLGAGLGGTIMAFEMKAKLKSGDKLTLLSDTPTFHFVPSNPWVAVGWRTQSAIEVDLKEVCAKKGIEFISVGAKRVHPDKNSIELTDGGSIDFDYLVIATGPELAFDEVEGLGPFGGHSDSICHVEHATKAYTHWQEFVANPGPIVVGAVQGASCFGPAYEFAFILDTDLRRRKIRDRVPITFATPEPYVGHLGVDGIGNTKSLLEGEFRDHHIKWITNAKTTKLEDGKIFVDEVNADGSTKAQHEIEADYAMMLPAFRGVEAVIGIEGLTNPRGFIVVDDYQRNPTFPNIFGVGVCIAIPPVGPTPLPVGVPKTGYMIESMVSAAAENIRALMNGREPATKASWSAICLADFGDTGVAFMAQPQIPPRNVNWAKKGKWVHLVKVAFERHFLGKIRAGKYETFSEKIVLDLLGIKKFKP